MRDYHRHPLAPGTRPHPDKVAAFKAAAARVGHTFTQATVEAWELYIQHHTKRDER